MKYRILGENNDPLFWDSTLKCVPNLTNKASILSFSACGPTVSMSMDWALL